MKKQKNGLTKYFQNHPHQRGIIVSPKKKFIYMKPAKTAGTSILRGILEVHFQDIIHKKDHPKKFLRWLKNLSDEKLDGYFIFSVCRNPWDRVVSIAHYFDISLAVF